MVPLSLILSSFCLIGLVSGLCPEQCKCVEENASGFPEVVCSGSDLKIVPNFLNPSIQNLDISDNKITKLEGTLAFYERLETLDLSGNNFGHIGKRQFSSNARLQLLNVSNNFLSLLHENSFVGLKALQTLDLSHNALKDLLNNTFKGMDSLVELRLDRNKLETISPLAFVGLTRLRVLHIEHNNLVTLKPEWLAPLANTRFLYSGHNQLKDLPDDLFKSLTALSVLTLEDNKMEDIRAFTFRGCKKVDTLDLARNKLSSTPAEALAHMSQLKQLDLSGNPITKLEKKSFQDLYDLEELKMCNMSELTSIDGYTFLGNLRLRELYLEHNPYLEPLPWGLFSSNSQLSHLSLKGNSWSSLSPHQIPQHALQTLQIEGLPLDCNCSIIWLWQLYQQGENSTIELDQVKCYSVAASPAESGKGGQSGDPLAIMSPDQLICPDLSGVLFAVSIGILVTVAVLVIAALLIYKCRKYYVKKRHYGSSCMYIKDDTMIYKPSIQHTYKTVSASSAEDTYSPTEPFYEVPQFGKINEESKPKSFDSNSSKYSSTGYVGNELWEADFPTQTHFYTNPVHQRFLTNNVNNSPQSTSTVLSTGCSSSSNASSTTSSTGGPVRPVFYSPGRMQYNSASVHNSPMHQMQRNGQSSSQRMLLMSPNPTTRTLMNGGRLQQEQQRKRFQTTTMNNARRRDDEFARNLFV